MKVHIDFESRSAVDIWEAGAWVYSRHRSTEVLCVCFAVDDGPVQKITFAELQDNFDNFAYHMNEMKSLARLAKDPSVTFHAFNAFFEQCIWKNIMVPHHGMPPVGIKRWRCTQSKSNAFALPASLDKAAQAYGIEELKDNVGKNIMLKLSKTRNARKSDVPGQLYWNDSTPEDWQALVEYCAQDVIVERELDKKLPDLPPAEQEVWFVDQLINMRGVRTDVDFVSKVRGILTEHNARLNGELSAFTGGQINKGTEVAKITEYLQQRGVPITDLNKETVSGLLKAGKLDDHCLQILRYRQELGKSSNAKYDKLLTSTDEDEIVRDCFVYSQAGTGRWGGKLVQLQNLPVNRENWDIEDAIYNFKNLDYATLRFIYGDRLNVVASACLRGVLIPRDGNEFLVVDYAAIEARVVFWLAGEEKGLTEFRESDAGTGPEIYVRMAQRIYSNMQLTKANKAERGLGKTAILGLGFQMGAKRFVETCKNWGVYLPEHLYTVTTDHEGNQKVECSVVDLYRSDYSRVVSFWYDTERAAIKAVNHPGTQVQCGKVSWFYMKERDYLFARLPSGRFLCYQAPRIENSKYGPKLSYMTDVNKMWVRQNTFGGHLVENLTQATARDLMAYSMPRLETVGLPIAIHTHDELVSESPIGSGRLQEMVDIMCDIPKWAEGLPVKAEGFVTTRYMKK